MSGSHEMSRRDFIKVTTGIVGGVIGAAIGLPTIFYLIDPALKEGGKDVWVSIGKFEEMQVGVPYPFSFTRVQVNGWERTSNSFGGYAHSQIGRPQRPVDPEQPLHAPCLLRQLERGSQSIPLPMS